MTIMADDIFLVTGRISASMTLVSAQKAVYPKARSSHVELHLGDGTLIHSTADGGVHLTFLLDELKSIKDNWSVIRLKGLSESERDGLITAALFFWQQSYNKRFFLKSVSHASFYSEFIAKAYLKAGMPILAGKKPSRVAPAHFDKALDKRLEWEDVTHEYNDLISRMQSEEWKYRFAFSTIQGALNKRNALSKMRTDAFQYIQDVSLVTDEQSMFDLIESLKKQLTEKRTLTFWNERDCLPYKDKGKN
ncbi:MULTISPECIES: hypothetical protein [Gammaproteobacteria]|uniref:hypothetical protein n=1 Tax=Pantoea sp. BJFS-204 TaxID=3404823 RepID=UPI003BB4A46A